MYRFLLLCLFFVHMSACSENGTRLDTVKKAGVITVISRLTPESYLTSTDISHSFEQELIQAYAKSINVKVEYKIIHPRLLVEQLEKNQADVAAAFLNMTRTSRLDFSEPYLSVEAVIVRNRDVKEEDSKLQNSSGYFVLPEGPEQSDYAELVGQHMPDSEIQLDDVRDSEELLQAVANKEIPATVVTSNLFYRMRQYYPSLIHEVLPASRSPELVFAFSRTDDSSLKKSINAFLAEMKESGELSRMVNRHYRSLEKFSYWDSLAFVERIETRLPEYRNLFVETGEQYPVDWRLLAAIAYQESHWDEEASSFTGVKGLMMLTSDTAAELGIMDRTDPLQSIDGGARYLLKLKDRIPDRIPEPDRSWLALAAYNIGFGHLEDARKLTQMEGHSPDSWYQVKQYLPRLSDKRWYSQTRYGKARGSEPVHFVQNIRRYYETLLWFDEARNDLRHVQRRLNEINVNPASL